MNRKTKNIQKYIKCTKKIYKKIQKGRRHSDRHSIHRPFFNIQRWRKGERIIICIIIIIAIIIYNIIITMIIIICSQSSYKYKYRRKYKYKYRSKYKYKRASYQPLVRPSCTCTAQQGITGSGDHFSYGDGGQIVKRVSCILKWLSCGVPILFLLLRIQEAIAVLEIELDLQQKLYHVGPITSWPHHPENSNLEKN